MCQHKHFLHTNQRNSYPKTTARPIDICKESLQKTILDLLFNEWIDNIDSILKKIIDICRICISCQQKIAETIQPTWIQTELCISQVLVPPKTVASGLQTEGYGLVIPRYALVCTFGCIINSHQPYITPTA